jgi:hypothetical protein
LQIAVMEGLVRQESRQTASVSSWVITDYSYKESSKCIKFSAELEKKLEHTITQSEGIGKRVALERVRNVGFRKVISIALESIAEILYKQRINHVETFF